MQLDAEIVRWGLMGIMGLLVYFMRRAVDQNDASVERLKLELQAVKLDYLHRNDFREFKQEIRGLFDDLKKDIKDIGRAE